MDKFGKREKIILGLMAIALLYAAFDFLTSRKKDQGVDMGHKTAELNTFVTDLTGSLGKDTSKNLDTLVFSRAEKEWTQDPFLDTKAYLLWNEAKMPVKSAAPKIDIAYTGYLEVGRKRMAILNGVEYREGDPLDIKGLVLKTISPTRVTIENSTTRKLLNVPLEE
jgi:hypothetical protein